MSIEIIIHENVSWDNWLTIMKQCNDRIGDLGLCFNLKQSKFYCNPYGCPLVEENSND